MPDQAGLEALLVRSFRLSGEAGRRCNIAPHTDIFSAGVPHAGSDAGNGHHQGAFQALVHLRIFA